MMNKIQQETTSRRSSTKMKSGEIKQILEDSVKKDKDEKQQKMERIRAKILTIARMNKMLRTMRENKEALGKIKQLAPTGKVPVGTVMGGAA